MNPIVDGVRELRRRGYAIERVEVAFSRFLLWECAVIPEPPVALAVFPESFREVMTAKLSTLGFMIRDGDPIDPSYDLLARPRVAVGHVAGGDEPVPVYLDLGAGADPVREPGSGEPAGSPGEPVPKGEIPGSPAGAILAAPGEPGTRPLEALRSAACSGCGWLPGECVCLPPEPWRETPRRHGGTRPEGGTDAE